MSLLESILPCDICHDEQTTLQPGQLQPLERKQLDPRTTSKRLQEFATGRFSARAALGKLGLPPIAILKGPNGEPLWPRGVVGSITHCAGFYAAAVAHESLYRSIGIDAEVNEPLPSAVLELISLPSERYWILHKQQSPISWDRLLFSIKESIYKLWYPLERRWLGFKQVEVILDEYVETFTASILTPSSITPSTLSGKYHATSTFIVTATWL